MPADKQDQQRSIDLRPAGAVAGAALPAKSLLEYMRDYPAFKRMVEMAEDARTAPTAKHPRGLVNIKKILDNVRTGDYGLSGVQGSSDWFTNTLVGGSNAASGGAGAHGQIAGPNVKVHHNISKTPKGQMTPDLAFLRNDHGELYSPFLAKDREKFIRATEQDVPWVDTGNRGTGEYGEAKAKLTAAAKQKATKLQQIRAQQKAWAQYDAAGGSAVSGNVKPKFSRPSSQALTDARKQRVGSLGEFRRVLDTLKKHDDFFTKDLTPATQADEFLAGLRHPASQAAENSAKKQRLTALAEKFKTQAATNPRMKALSNSILDQVDNVGVPGPAFARSTAFKPKKYETFIPTVLHGGMHNNQNVLGADTPLSHIAKYIGSAFSPAQFKAYMRGEERYGPFAMMDWLRDNKALQAKQMQQAKDWPGMMYYHNSGKLTNETAGRTPRFRGAGTSADNVYRHTILEGSRMDPAGHYFGPKSTLWMRPNSPVDSAALEKLIKAEGLKPYAPGNAAVGAIGEITGLSNLAKYVPGFNKATCQGNMCGSFPAHVYEQLGVLKNKYPASITLPNRVALQGFTPTVVSNKQLMLKQLRTAGGRRALLGVGAMGLMGAAGYSATGAAQNALSSAVKPISPPVPVPTPNTMPSFKGMGKYAPIAAVGAGSLAALAAAHAWGRSRRKKPADELSPTPA